MTGWIIFAVYVVGYLWTTRHLAVSLNERDAREELHRRDLGRRGERSSEPLVDTEFRLANLVMAALIALLWPLALAVLAVAPRMRAPTEIAEQERRELEALRKLARDHDLPMP